MARVPVHSHSGIDDGGPLDASHVAALAGTASDATSSASSGAAPAFGSPVAIGPALDDGTGSLAARSNHVHSGLGAPLALTGATAATRYAGGTASGAPASGTFAVGDFVVDQAGAVWVCTVAGSPGTWAAPGGAAVGSSTPLVESGLGSAGVSANASREDHVHPAAGGSGARAAVFAFDGGGSAISSGKSWDVYFAVGGTISAWHMVADGTVTIDLWRTTYTAYDNSTHPVVGDSICAGSPPAISSGVKAEASVGGCVGTVISAADVVRAVVSAGATATRVQLTVVYS